MISEQEILEFKKLLQDYLNAVRNVSLNDDVLDFLKQQSVSIPQNTLLETARKTLLQFNVFPDNHPADGVCDAMSKMHQAVIDFNDKSDENTFFKGLVLIALHDSSLPYLDFSYIILSFYLCAKSLQTEAFKYELSNEAIINLLRRPAQTLVKQKFNLPFLYTAQEIKDLFDLLIKNNLWRNSGAQFLLGTDEHVTSGSYRNKKFTFEDVNFLHGQQETMDLNNFVEFIITALSVVGYKGFDKNNNNSYLPLILETFINSQSKENKTNIAKFLEKLMPNFDFWKTANRFCPDTNVTAIWLAAQSGNAAAIELFLQWHVNPNRARKSDGFTPLMVAIANRHYDAAWNLLQFFRDRCGLENIIEIDLGAKDLKGNTALHTAAYTLDVKYIQLVLQSIDPTVLPALIHDVNDQGESPLYIACFYNKLDMVQSLLKYHASPNQLIKNKPLLFKALEDNVDANILIELMNYGAEVINPQTGESILSTAIQLQKDNFVLELMKHPALRARIRHLTNYNSYKSVFFDTIRKQNYEMFSALLYVFPELLQTVEDRTGNNPLHVAVAYPDKQFVELICEANYQDIDDYNFKGESALYIAAKIGQAENIRILLSHNFPNVPTASIENGLVSADQYKQPLESPLVIGVMERKLEAVQTLIQIGADTNTTYNGGKPIIHCAIQSNDVEIAECLIKDGVDPNQLCQNEDDDEVEKSLLSIAVKEKHFEMAGKLIELGADVNAPAEYQQAQKAPLYYAVVNNDAKMCALLLKHGADADLEFIVDEENEDNEDDEKTALQIAQKNNYQEIIWLINFYQQKTLQAQVRTILATSPQAQNQATTQYIFDPSRRHVAPRSRRSGLAELQTNLANIVASNLSKEVVHEAITKELFLAKSTYVLPDAVKKQINWYLDHMAADMPKPQPVAANNMAINPEDISTQDMLALAQEFAVHQL